MHLNLYYNISVAYIKLNVIEVSVIEKKSTPIPLSHKLKKQKA